MSARSHALAFLFLVALQSTTVRAEEKLVYLSSIMGSNLAEVCAHSQGMYADFCTGYILGSADQLILARRLCMPAEKGLTIQIVEIARKYVRENPEKWHLNAYSLVEEPLLTAFPCN
jgi:Rap1a immunity proteins